MSTTCNAPRCPFPLSSPAPPHSGSYARGTCIQRVPDAAFVEAEGFLVVVPEAGYTPRFAPEAIERVGPAAELRRVPRGLLHWRASRGSPARRPHCRRFAGGV